MTPTPLTTEQVAANIIRDIVATAKACQTDGLCRDSYIVAQAHKLAGHDVEALLDAAERGLGVYARKGGAK